MSRRPTVIRPSGADYEVRVLGARSTPLRDFYHALLRFSWPSTVGFLAAAFLMANTLFGLLFMWSGGIAHAAAGSFMDAFYFSVQTMGTIGYGALYPESPLANGLVVGECILGLTLVALATGLVFAKFSRPTARITFSENAVICPMNGVPTLMLRVGNERGNTIVDAQFRAVVSRTERTLEGEIFYRVLDLKLARERALTLNRSFTLLHSIDETSPFFGQNAESITAQEYELQLLLVGLDDLTMQSLHATKNYFARHILWEHRFKDVLSIADDGAMILDLSKFHEVESAPLSRTV